MRDAHVSPEHSTPAFFVGTSWKMNKSIAEKLQGEGAFFYPWATPHWTENPPGDDEAVYRLVTSFASEASEIDRFIGLLDA